MIAQREFRNRILNDVLSKLNALEKIALLSSIDKFEDYIAKDLEKIKNSANWE
jgi:hypothetical protein